MKNQMGGIYYNMYEVPEHLIIAQVEAHMRQLGISPAGNHIITADGKIHRYTIEGDKGYEKNGAYVIFTDGVPAWYLKAWNGEIDVTGHFDKSALNGYDLTAYEERISDKAYLDQCRIRRETLHREEIKRKKKATEDARKLYDSAMPIQPEHEYLVRKRISNIQGFRRGGDGEILIPLHHAKTGDFMTLQRIFPNGRKYFIQDTGTGQACFEFVPEEALDKLIFVCEGVATGDTIFRLTWKRFRTVCAMTCNNLDGVIKALQERFPRAEIVICADNDLGTYAKTGNNPGRSRAEFVVKAGHAKGIILPDFMPHQDGSDWNDYEALNGQDKTSKEIFRQLDTVLASHGENPAEEKDKAQLVFERLCSMRDKFLKGRRLFHIGSIKHGEYYQYHNEGGYWYRMNDADLVEELSTFFDHKETNRHLHELAEMIRNMIHRKEPPAWNKGRLDNFPNGTLELDTGILREHRPEDFITFSHTFNYDPTATSLTTYTAFMQAISNGQQSRIDHLEDVIAYTLYGDNRLEKLFFIIGGGANGKGTFLHMVEDLFRSANTRSNFNSVTHVQPCDMDKPTERIHLEGSILNIAYDIDRDLRGCSSHLKSLAADDVITGNAKFCDSHSFTSRAKIISSCNHMPIIDDDSYGMRRKLMFCRFEASFKEGTADTHILEKLQASLPAIYNRVYRAYQELRKREAVNGQDAIRPSCDQPELLTEFAVLADPIRDFWYTKKEEYLERGEVSKPQAYEDFKTFAARNNIDLISRGFTEYSFHEAFFHLLEEDESISASNDRKRRDKETKKQPRYYTMSRKQEYEQEAQASQPEQHEAPAPAHERPKAENTTPSKEGRRILEQAIDEGIELEE